jgi:small subunit ribosomal protein S6
MREYELVFIVHPDLDETALNEVVERVKAWITDASGKIEKIEQWGRRKLAYPVRKQLEGQYIVMHLSMAPATCAALERNLRFLEPVMRFSVISQ